MENLTFGDDFQEWILNMTTSIGQVKETTMTNKDEWIRNVLNTIKIYYTPVLVPFGVLSNLVCGCVLLFTSFNRASCTVYVIGITLCNSTFLITFLFIWLSKFGVHVYNTPGLCQLLTLLSCTANFLSCWYAIFLASDRCILLYHPRLKRHLCTTMTAKVVTTVAATFAIAIHVNVSLTVDVHTIPGQGRLCLPIPVHMDALNILGKVDVFFNVIFAYGLLIVLCVAIWTGLMLRARSHRHQRSGYQYKVDMMFGRASCVLLTMLLTLCAPSQMVRLYCTFRELVGHTQPTPYIYSIQQLLQYPYYTGFAMSGVVYILTMDLARKALKAACFKLYRRTQSCSQPDKTVTSLASCTVIAMTEITTLKSVSLL